MAEESPIKVKVIQLGKKIFQYEGRPQNTVGDALKTAGVIIDHLRSDIRLNGHVVTQNTTLHDGDIVTVLPPVKGGR